MFKIPDEWEEDTSLAIWENVEFIYKIFYDWYRTHVFVGEKNLICFNQNTAFFKDCIIDKMINLNQVFMFRSFVKDVKNTTIENAVYSIIYKLNSNSVILNMKDSIIIKR